MLSSSIRNPGRIGVTALKFRAQDLSVWILAAPASTSGVPRNLTTSMNVTAALSKDPDANHGVGVLEAPALGVAPFDSPRQLLYQSL
eukprot:m.320304 g.320304  ORF g.320304 m.320304 type:complete len:87 (+) comp55509_c0_seq9:1598-1858(+)